MKTILAEFTIKGDLRFISHKETMKLWRYALSRADIPVAYSQGFNPRPIISLPLPRSVGLASESELITIRLADENSQLNGLENFKNNIAVQLPTGCELNDISIRQGKDTIQPENVTYTIKLKKQADWQKISKSMSLLNNALQGKTPVLVERRKVKKGRSHKKQIDIAGFIKIVSSNQPYSLEVITMVTNSGTVRIEELLELLCIESQTLEEPVCRRHVDWR